jgi:hypothetical protein
MRVVTGMLRQRRTGLLLAVVLAGAVSGCGHSGSAAAGKSGVSGVSCTSYALAASGKYRDEVSVKVQVSNTATRAARYAIDVEVESSSPKAASDPSAQVTVSGSVAPRSSAELGHKVLTSGPVKRCRVTQVTRS